MAWRQLPDGSYFDPNTGDLRGLDGAKEAAAHAQSLRAGHIKPRPRKAPLPPVHGSKNKFPPLPLQRFVVLPGIEGPEAIIDPVKKLALNPYELGMGEMSTTMKRTIAVAGILAAVGGACYLCKKMSWFGGSDKKKSK